MNAQQELIKFITENGISYKVALNVLKRHFKPADIQILYPGHNPGGLY